MEVEICFTETNESSTNACQAGAVLSGSTPTGELCSGTSYANTQHQQRCHLQQLWCKNLTTLITSASNVAWYTAPVANSSSLVSSPDAVAIEGSYYAFSKSGNHSMYINHKNSNEKNIVQPAYMHRCALCCQ